MSKRVLVAVGVVLRGHEVFLTKRPENSHQGGKWEFPGGKVELGETVPEALHRELQEEIGIDTLACEPLIKVEHDYGDKNVCLDVYLIEHFQNEPRGIEGQAFEWVNVEKLKSIDFPAANVPIVDAIEAKLT